MRARTIKIILAIILTAFGFLFVYFLIFLQFVSVPTGSMSNTIIPGDHLLVKKRVSTIARGDLLIFQAPASPSEIYIARLIGLPGETIEIRDTRIYINDKVLPELRVTVTPEPRGSSAVLEELSTEGDGPYRVFYYPREAEPGPSGGEYGTLTPLQILENQYFVMGDNRDNSEDSRYWGTVSREAIVGKPTLVVWSSHFNQSGVEEIKWERVFSRIK